MFLRVDDDTSDNELFPHTLNIYHFIDTLIVCLDRKKILNVIFLSNQSLTVQMAARRYFVD